MTKKWKLIYAAVLVALFGVVIYAAEVTPSYTAYPSGTGLPGGNLRSAIERRVAMQEVTTIVAGNGATMDCRGMRFITVRTAAGTTATISFVDTQAATSHETVSTFTVGASTQTATNVIWPYARVSSAVGTTVAYCAP